MKGSSEFKGEIVGVRLSDRGPGDKHQIFTILCEDDEYWGETNASFSTAYLDEMILVLVNTKKFLERRGKQTPEDKRWGGFSRKWKN